MPKTLLLADDSVTIQKVVGISFANEDIEITTVDNGRDAVAKARALRPDVILADVVMPGMSGYEVCETVKADPSLRHIPVLLLTGTFEAFDQVRAAAVGAAGHVAKPFEAQTLVDRVKQLLAAAPAPRAAAAPRPAAAPAPAPMPAPAVVPAAAPAVQPPVSDDAFDFFSDASEQPATPAPPPAPSADALDFDGPDGAFAFGDEDLAGDLPDSRASTLPPVGTGAARAATPDATIAMLADPRSRARERDNDVFEFSFDRALSPAFDEPLNPDQLGHTTLLDPAAGSGLDISSSDLAFDTPPPVPAATQILSFRDDEPPQSLPLAAEDAELDLAEAEPFEPREERSAPRPFGVSDPYGTTIAPVARAPRGELHGAFERDAFEDPPMMVGEPLRADEDLDEHSPLGTATAVSDPLDTDPWDAPSPAPYQPPAAAPAPVAVASSAAPPIARADLHDALEKIAWDAFAPITEKIVREALARVEQVVWEVVPKLAETLIQEEIRRLKGGAS